jgi:hypothetical protein
MEDTEISESAFLAGLASRLRAKADACEVVDPQLCDDVLRVLRRPKRDSPAALLLPDDLDIANKPGGLDGVAAQFAIVYLARRSYVSCCAVNYGLAADPAGFVAQARRTAIRNGNR